MKILIVSPPMALAFIQPVANHMLHLPCMSAEIAESPAGRAVATSANGLKTLCLREPRTFEHSLIEGETSWYGTG